MSSAGWYIIVLVILLSTKTVSMPLSSGDGRIKRSDDAQVLAAVIDNLGSRLSRLEASNTVIVNELRAKQCEAGVMSFTPHSRPGVLWSDGSVRRIHSVHVNFSRPFASKPWVSVAITHLDVRNNANLRIDVGVDAISTSGFDALAYEWADTDIVLVYVSWVACNI